MVNDEKWSRWGPEQHVDEAQRLCTLTENASPEEFLFHLKVAQVHATLAGAKMTDRLDTTLTEVRNFIAHMSDR